MNGISSTRGTTQSGKPAAARGSARPAGRSPIRLTIAALAIPAALISGCAPKAPPAPPPPPPAPAPVAEAVPYRPLPPGGAAYVLDVPPRGPDGRRMTVNSNLTDDQLVWNLRSAWNVAALNCLGPEYEPILASYSAFLKGNARPLKAVNDRIESSFTRRFSTKRDAIVARDGYTTQVYNFFATPGVRAGFCRAALDMANRAATVPPSDPLAFAKANFDGLLAPFDQFFAEYEAYQKASAAWDAKWGAQFGPSQPGWVAVQEARANGVAVPQLGVSDPAATLARPTAPAQTVIDPQTGVAVPVVPVREGVISQPVVEPFPSTPQPKRPG